MEYDKNEKPVVEVDGVIASGKQFDLDIRLPEDDRNVIFGVIKDSHSKPVRDAVVKLIEIVYEHGKEERRPVSHTFTDKHGEFVLGPLCDKKSYAIQIWADAVKHSKIKVKAKHEGECLKGVKFDDKPEYKPDEKPDYKPDYKPDEKPDHKPDYKPEDRPNYPKEYTELAEIIISD